MTSVTDNNSEVIGLGEFESIANVCGAADIDSIANIVAEGAGNSSISKRVAGLVGKVGLHNRRRGGNAKTVMSVTEGLSRGRNGTHCVKGLVQDDCRAAQAAASYVGSWQGDPIGLVATKRPPTVALSRFQVETEGQQESPGRQ